MTIIEIHHTAPARDIPAIDSRELGERLLDEVVGFTRLSLPNAAAIVLAMDALRDVAASQGLDAACLWIGSDKQAA
ncbi:hypothetical protein E8L99_17670 [Phreatobacter aquaticus]|uniref:Uncharacterized protein n=1 Tax=Phreatobacter aquaticus TaxID=2570229 RepID=A0A4D7QPE7_9HYPH|nr:hypothetical protein [Phreatobacter aquaticus]QCK87456.1 hypothetical protein E8L99_17670 [Phreatobacter aquaticus]